MPDLNKVENLKEKLSFLQGCIKSVQDFPKPGILFRDVTSLVENKEAFHLCMDLLYDLFADARIDKVMCAEARGFVFGAPLADRLKAGCVMARKPGKLPRAVISESYDLEYGQNTLQIHADAIKAGERVLILDDLIATGGTLEAMIRLARRQQAEVVSVALIIELFDLGGVERIRRDFQVDCFSLLKFPGH